MSARLKELQEQRNQRAAKIREVAERYDQHKKSWKDPADEAAWKSVNAEYDATVSELEAERKREADAAAVAQRLADLDAADRESRNRGGSLPGLEDSAGRKPVGGDDGGQITEEGRALALAGWMAGQLGRRQTERQVEAMRACGIQPWQRELELVGPDTRTVRDLQRRWNSVHASRAMDHCLEQRVEQRDLSAVQALKGGVTIGTTLLKTLEINMLAYGGMRQVAETIVTTTGERMVWPTGDDTSNTGEIIGESTAIGSSTDPSFAGVAWDAYKFSSKPVLVPYELIEDSYLDLPAVLGTMLGERVGRITNTRYTTGSGASQPRGIITAATLGVSAASATAITADEIINLVHSVDPAYRATGCRFMMHDSVLLYIRKLKDSQNRYLMEFGLQTGMPDSILGFGVTNNQDMASSVATTNKTILFGRLSDYKIRRVRSVRMYRLEERYRDTDQDGFILLVREDGNLLNAGTATCKYLQQA